MKKLFKRRVISADDQIVNDVMFLSETAEPIISLSQFVAMENGCKIAQWECDDWGSVQLQDKYGIDPDNIALLSLMSGEYAEAAFEIATMECALLAIATTLNTIPDRASNEISPFLQKEFKQEILK